MLRRLIVAATAAALLGGCGDQSRLEKRPSHLVVRETHPATPRYIEGSLSFLRVEKTGGEVVIDGPVTDGRNVSKKKPLFDRELEAGRYRLVSYQRPCQGNCERLDPPTDRCEATFRLEAGVPSAVTVVLRQEGGCTVREEKTSDIPVYPGS